VITGNPTLGPQTPFALPGDVAAVIAVGGPNRFHDVRDFYSEEIESAIIDDLAADRGITQLADAVITELGEEDLTLALEEALNELLHPA
jgi:hypothetical protein